jgi:hypothetical protein
MSFELGGIEGLEVVSCRAEGIRRTSDTEISELTAKLEKLDKKIGKALIASGMGLASPVSAS